MFASHIDPKVIARTPEKKANRHGYGEGLLEAGKRDERVVALSADLTESTRTITFAEEFPQRFIQVGITEQNMASVAAGMAMMGKIPFIASYAMFSPGRNWEQIRTTVAYNNSNVKVIGAHAGISVGPDGATHQAIEDIALMRVIPNMVVLAPMDVHEARKATLWAAQYEGPVYMRIGRSDTPVVTTSESPFIFGVAQTLYEKSNDAARSIALLVTGTLSYEALLAAQMLEERGIAVTVLHFATIKPLDVAALKKAASEHTMLVTIEEHQVAGGFGSAVAEYVASACPVRVLRIGINDEFGQSGEPEELLVFYKLDAASIADAAGRALSEI